MSDWTITGATRARERVGVWEKQEAQVLHADYWFDVNIWDRENHELRNSITNDFRRRLLECGEQVDGSTFVLRVREVQTPVDDDGEKARMLTLINVVVTCPYWPPVRP